MFSINRRMHNKAWIADGRIAVVGGRNVGDEYFDAARDTNFMDMDAALMGPAVGQAEQVFDAYWNNPMPCRCLRWSPQSRRHWRLAWQPGRGHGIGARAPVCGAAQALAKRA